MVIVEELVNVRLPSIKTSCPTTVVPSSSSRADRVNRGLVEADNDTDGDEELVAASDADGVVDNELLLEGVTDADRERVDVVVGEAVGVAVLVVLSEESEASR